VRPMVKLDGRFKPATWSQVTPLLKQELAANQNLVVVLSPFLTVEEAFLLALLFSANHDRQGAGGSTSPPLPDGRGSPRNVRLVLGPVPVIGEDDHYPKDVKGNAVEPTKFTIRAEKCPNRRGVEAVLAHFQGAVIPF